MADPRTNVGRNRRISLYWIWAWANMRFGLEANGIHFVGGANKGSLYLDQFLLHLGFFTLRVHCFHRGDDARAPHDHPFWFITFPLTGYNERYYSEDTRTFRTRWVAPWRFHFRSAKHRHVVKKVLGSPSIWTIVISGRYTNKWGFWPTPNMFVPASQWERYCREHRL